MEIPYSRSTREPFFHVGTWLSLVEHSLGVRGVGSSNLPVPTNPLSLLNMTTSESPTIRPESVGILRTHVQSQRFSLCLIYPPNSVTRTLCRIRKRIAAVLFTFS